MTGWLRGLFLTALVGVLAAVGLVVGSLLGPVAVVVYVVVVVVGLGTLSVLSARRIERERAAVAAASGRSCSCCTTSQHDPVKVI